MAERLERYESVYEKLRKNTELFVGNYQDDLGAFERLLVFQNNKVDDMRNSYLINPRKDVQQNFIGKIDELIEYYQEKQSVVMEYRKKDLSKDMDSNKDIFNYKKNVAYAFDFVKRADKMHEERNNIGMGRIQKYLIAMKNRYTNWEAFTENGRIKRNDFEFILDLDLTKKLDEIKNKYTENIVSGRIGTVDSVEQQDGITNLALLVLVSNRITKLSRYSKSNLDDEQKKGFYNDKNEAFSSLIANLYVLKNTDEDYKDIYSYGDKLDENGESAFTIDLPGYGPISMHYGLDKGRSFLIKKAKEKTVSILEEKYKLKQISKEEKDELINNLSDDREILPEYKGKLYETRAGMPIMKNMPKRSEAKTENDKKYWEVSDCILDEDIKKVVDLKGLNDREKIYLLITNEAYKSQIDEFWDLTNEKSKHNKRLDARKIGKKSIELVKPNEVISVDNILQRENSRMSGEKGVK